jgi:hypothetical protein
MSDVPYVDIKFSEDELRKAFDQMLDAWKKEATTARTYDPSFGVPPKPNHEGECQFVRFHRYLERCSLPGCPCGRISRDWIASMRAAHNTRSD